MLMHETCDNHSSHTCVDHVPSERSLEGSTFTNRLKDANTLRQKLERELADAKHQKPQLNEILETTWNASSGNRALPCASF